LWTADFNLVNGQLATHDGVYCYPLTIADQHTRFLLASHGVPSTHAVLARPIFERTFRTYGRRQAIRTDNGVPFATNALHGLSDLNVWWMRLGIQHQRIHPGRPQENGAHERMRCGCGLMRCPALVPCAQRPDSHPRSRQRIAGRHVVSQATVTHPP
jgi:putative transposase